MAKFKGIVIAGSFRQFLNWLREDPDRKEQNYIYVYNQQSVAGLPFGLKVIKIGTWYEREWTDGLIEWLEAYEHHG